MEIKKLPIFPTIQRGSLVFLSRFRIFMCNFKRLYIYATDY